MLVIIFENYTTSPWTKTICIFFGMVSTAYSYAWDIKMDWGLLSKEGKHPFLRNEITFPPFIYYIACILNLFLRVAWGLKLFPRSFGNMTFFFFAFFFKNFLHYFYKNLKKKTKKKGWKYQSIHAPWISLLFSDLEIFRRCMWNVFRLENEHLNNCGQFRIVNEIPPLVRMEEFEKKQETEKEECEDHEEELQNEGNNETIQEELVKHHTMSRRSIHEVCLFFYLIFLFFFFYKNWNVYNKHNTNQINYKVTHGKYGYGIHNTQYSNA